MLTSMSTCDIDFIILCLFSFGNKVQELQSIGSLCFDDSWNSSLMFSSATAAMRTPNQNHHLACVLLNLDVYPQQPESFRLLI